MQDKNDESDNDESPLKAPRLEVSAPSPPVVGPAHLTPQALESRLQSIRARVAQPYRRGFPDPQPAILQNTGVLIGNQPRQFKNARPHGTPDSDTNQIP